MFYNMKTTTFIPLYLCHIISFLCFLDLDRTFHRATIMDNDAYPGKEIDGYLILKKLSQGSFGSVYLAREVIAKRIVAIKFLHEHLLDEQEQLELDNFFQEAEFLAKLEHPHILRIYRASAKPPYIAVELASDGSLKDRLAQEKKPLPLEEVLTI